MDEKQLQALYNSLSSHLDIGDYNSFKAKMQTPDDRKNFYNAVSKEGFDIGDYDSFEKRIGGEKKNSGNNGSLLSNIGTMAGNTGSETRSTGKTNLDKALDHAFTGDYKPEPVVENKDTITQNDVENDPVKTILYDKRKQYDAASKDYYSAHRQLPSDNTTLNTSGSQLKLKSQSEDLLQKQYQFKDAATNFSNALATVGNHVFQNGKVAGDYLNSVAQKNGGKLPDNNETVQLAIQKNNQYNQVVNDIQNYGSITMAALANAKKDNPLLAKQLQAAGQMPDALEGRYVAQYLNEHNNDIEAYVNNNPKDQNDKDDYESLKSGLLTRFPEFGANVVANEVSRARQQAGMNSMILNTDSKAFEDETDRLAERMYKNDPVKKQIYDSVIKGDKSKYIDTPSFLNSFGQSFGRSVEGSINSVRDLLGDNNTSNDIYGELNKQSNSVSADAKGIHGALATAGDFAGVIAFMATAGSVFKGAGVNPLIADKIVTGLTFGDQMLKEGEMKYPDEKWKAYLSGITNTAAFMMLSNIFPSGKVAQVFEKAKPEFENAIKDLSEESIANGVAKNKLNDVITNVVGQYGKGISEMGGLTLFNQALDKGLGMDEKSYAQFHPESELADVVKSMAIGNLLPSIIVGAKEGVRNTVKDNIWEMASNPKRAESILSALAIDHPEQSDEIKQRLDNLNFITKVKTDLDTNTELNDTQKKNYLLQSVNEKLLQDKVSNITDPKLKEQPIEQIGQSQKIKDDILSGEDNGTDILPQEKKVSVIMPEDNKKPNVINSDSVKERKSLIDEATKSADDITGVYKSVFLDNPEQVMKEAAEQLNSSPDEARVARATFGDKISDIALKLFPDAKVESTNQEADANNQQGNISTEEKKPTEASVSQDVQQPEKSDYDHFKEQMLSELENRSKDKFDLKINHELLPVEQKTIEQGIKNIREGKDTKAAQQVEAAIKKMYDDGVVHYEAKSGKIHTQQPQGIPASHFIDISKEANKPIDINNDDHLHELNMMLGEDAFPHVVNEESANFKNQSDESTSKNDTGEGTIQQPTKGQAAESNSKVTGNEGGTPPQQPNATEPAAADNEGNTVGISHESRKERAEKLGENAPQSGDGVTIEQSIEKGKQLISDGADPQKVADDFKKDGKISENDMAIVRAKYNELAKATDEAAKKYGINSKEDKAAKAKESEWYDEVVKPMQTAWSNIGRAQQGETNIDTGSFAGMRRLFERENDGKEMNAKQTQEAKDLSSKVASLTTEVEGLKKKLSDVLNKTVAEETKSSKSIKEKAKNLANRLREQAKIHKPDRFSAATPASLAWDGAVEAVAKTIEAGGKIAQAISDGIDYIKSTDWYKGLDDKDKKDVEKEFSDWHKDELKSSEDITTRFADKKGNKFTNEEAKTIWDYAKKEYLDKDANFDDMINNTAMDLGLRVDQVRDALTTPKGTKSITDEMYKKQSDRNKAIQYAKDWAKASGKNPIIKFLGAIPRAFFAVRVAFHGTVGMITHAGINMADPKEWTRYWKAFGKQFKFAYGSIADYEKAMQDLQRDPQYLFFKRNGLAVDPTERYDDYQFISKWFHKLGTVGKWLTAGDRGFNALKVYRLERAKALYNRLSDVEKADPNTGKMIATLVNHSTGTSKIPLPEAANVVFFAPRLEASRWNRLIVDPANAIKTFANWKNSKPSERAAAKIVASRAGRILATYAGGLLANQALLIATGSNQRINFTDPTKSDFFKFKIGSNTVDMTGGIVSLFDFLVNMGHAATMSEKDLPKGQTRKDLLMKGGWNYGTGKLSPFAATVKDVATQHDFEGNTMPFSNDKPQKGKEQLSWKQYLLQNQLNIPASEGIRDVHKQMVNDGVSSANASMIIHGIIVGGMAGFAGVKIGDEPKEKQPQTRMVKDGEVKRPMTQEEDKQYKQDVQDELDAEIEEYKNNKIGIDKYGDAHLSTYTGTDIKETKDYYELTKKQKEDLLKKIKSSVTDKVFSKMKLEPLND